ncbi:hypothetical protein X797_012101 [Metarhizium robertsii]|uniref:Uncharacterized protein n=2 Tax=Metarhizium robertsii TaxID=568076 RepID=E9EM37_METRA|nr:uncharacterized protein MAA_01082 [Metarhizium robertsii ARSEF 23]EFZ04008.1 hypothetical protein MAA_01082 [Metarhizium robertsii ARSEF 23]EXU94822.1 hypothetical protein X797_012101 [Metarhizium robertsii]
MTKETLIASARLHNQFPPNTSFPQIDVLSEGFKELCAIITKYNAQSRFRLRLLHRHTTIPKEQILLGTSITKPPGFWTRPTPISDVDLQNIHPHIISVDNEARNGRLFPSEFREGPPASNWSIESGFFTEFTDYLRVKGWENIFRLEIIQGQTGKMIEFSFDIGSLLLEEAEVSGQFESQETAWTIRVRDGAVDKDGETRCVIIQGQHLRATKMLVKSVSDVLKVLRDEGVLL